MSSQTTLPLPKAYRFSPERPETASDLEKQSSLVIYASWARYLEFDAMFQGTGNRIRFLHQLLEIMPPISQGHEIKKTVHGALIETWCADHDIDLTGLGSATMKKDEEAGGEPDESYFIGEPKDRPDLVVEIALTSGGLSKREFYAQFKVPEIWIWREGKLEVYGFERGEYVESTESRVFPGLDLAVLEECAAIPKVSKAIRAFRKRTANA